jgi:chemotaxis regulatin CheY-phosphate phosphatase CheZ
MSGQNGGDNELGQAARMLDRALEEMPPAPDPLRSQSATAGGGSSLAALPATLLRAYGEICSVLQTLRQGRDALEQATIAKIQHTNEKLHEVSSATELAATGILDGLDRAMALVDELDSLDASGEERPAEVRNQLRDELFQAIGCLQFQDITTQQLSYASSILTEMETRLSEVVHAFDPATSLPQFPVLPDQPTSEPRAFDPSASIAGAEERQALVDQLFASSASG